MRGLASITRLLDLCFPRACAVCDQPLSDSEPETCATCTRALLAATAAPRCPRCGADAAPAVLTAKGCPACGVSSIEPIAGFARVAAYHSPIGAMIRRYKYSRQQRLDRFLGSMLAETIAGQTWAQELDALVPVPASFRERWQYGFHPVGLLAQAAGRCLHLPCLPVVTVHGKKRRQVELAAHQRPANVRNVFRLARRADVRGSCLCVVDDVATTTATVQAVARVLDRAGADRVYVATLARAAKNRADGASGA